MRISLLYALRWRMLYSWMLSWMIMCHDESSDDVYFFSIIWCNQMLIGNVDWSLILILCMENVWCTLLWIRPWNICIVFLVIMRSWDSKLRLWVGFITRWTTWYQSNSTNYWLNWSLTTYFFVYMYCARKNGAALIWSWQCSVCISLL